MFIRMGVKSKAAVAIVFLLLLLGSLWMQGGLNYQWKSCLKGYDQQNKHHHNGNNSTGSSATEGPQVLKECPGQKFQVSMLLSHLLASPAYSSDVLMQPYLSSWDELVKFMESLGPMVGLISKEIQTKTTVIRDLALLSKKSPEAELVPGEHVVGLSSQAATDAGMEAANHSGAYHSVHSMIRSELDRGLVNFQHQTDSGCRTLLRLHRALLWLRLFLEKLAEMSESGRLRSPSELCRESYQHTLSQHHTWFVRRAAELAFIAMPERGFFFKLVCVGNQQELNTVLTKVVRAIDEVYNRTQKALEENGMLDLP